MILKKLISGFILFCISFAGYTQQDSLATHASDSWWNGIKKNIRLGGNVGLQVGQQTMISASPNIAYWLTDNWNLGISGTYRFFSVNNGSFSSYIYGGSLFSQYRFFESILAHAEYEILNLDWTSTERINVTSILVGGGYSGQISSRFSTSLLILYNLNDHVYSPYTNPIVRAGVGYNL